MLREEIARAVVRVESGGDHSPNAKAYRLADDIIAVVTKRIESDAMVAAVLQRTSPNDMSFRQQCHTRNLLHSVSRALTAKETPQCNAQSTTQSKQSLLGTERTGRKTARTK